VIAFPLPKPALDLKHEDVAAPAIPDCGAKAPLPLFILLELVE
jgi:hypothetical protein